MNQPLFQTPAPLPRTCRDSSELLPAVNDAAVIKKKKTSTAAVNQESQATLFLSTEYVIGKIQNESIPSSKCENVKFGFISGVFQ